MVGVEFEGKNTRLGDGRGGFEDNGKYGNEGKNRSLGGFGAFACFGIDLRGFGGVLDGMPRNVILYTAPMCSDCDKLKHFMDANGIAYELRDIKKDPAHAQELAEQTGKQGVPYLVVDGKWVRGYEPRVPFSEDFARQILGL